MADVFLPDGQLLDYLLVKEGYARWFRRYALENETLKQLEAAAQKAKRGLWADKNPVSPWIYRKLKRGEKLGQSDNLPYISTPPPRR